MGEAISLLRRTFKPRTLKLILALVGWGLYAALFLLGFAVLGAQVGALVLLPVALRPGSGGSESDSSWGLLALRSIHSFST